MGTRLMVQDSERSVPQVLPDIGLEGLLHSLAIPFDGQSVGNDNDFFFGIWIPPEYVPQELIGEVGIEA